MEGEAKDGVKDDVGGGIVVFLKGFSGGQAGDVEVLTLFKETVVDVFVARLSRVSGLFRNLFRPGKTMLTFG